MEIGEDHLCHGSCSVKCPITNEDTLYMSYFRRSKLESDQFLHTSQSVCASSKWSRALGYEGCLNSQFLDVFKSTGWHDCDTIDSFIAVAFRLYSLKIPSIAWVVNNYCVYYALAIFWVHQKAGLQVPSASVPWKLSSREAELGAAQFRSLSRHWITCTSAIG